MPAQDDATVLFLFMAFGMLIVLLLILVAVGLQTWLLWKMARTIVEGKNMGSESEIMARMMDKMDGDASDVERRKSVIQEEQTHARRNTIQGTIG